MKLRMRRTDNRGRGAACVAVSLMAVFLVCASALAQLPGAAEADKADANEQQGSALENNPSAPAPDESWLARYYRIYLGPDSAYRPIILTIAVLLVLLWLKKYLTGKMARVVKANAYLEENAKGFLRVWNGIWKFVIAILVIMAMSGSFRLLGLTAGFLGMMLGWSLQQPVTGIAAWLMIVLKKPFRIGDRVIIAGITGDVTSISLTHVVLNQVGGSISGEERSGRGILIPNAILFQHVIINYTLEQKHMLDEVPVRLTFDTDWERSKQLMLEAAREATGDIIRETGQDPFIRVEFLDWGILARLRYNTIPVRRQEISTNVVERLIEKFSREYPRVRFAIPSTHIRYQPALGSYSADVAQTP